MERNVLQQLREDMLRWKLDGDQEKIKSAQNIRGCDTKWALRDLGARSDYRLGDTSVWTSLDSHYDPLMNWNTAICKKHHLLACTAAKSSIKPWVTGLVRLIVSEGLFRRCCATTALHLPPY